MKKRFLYLVLLSAFWNCGKIITKEIAVVSNEDSKSISFVDLQTEKVIKTLEVGKRPRGIKYAPKSGKIYVALSGSPKCPPWVDEEECAKKVTDKSADGIAKIDFKTMSVEAVFKAGSDPEQFDISKDEKYLYVANEDNATVSVIQTTDGYLEAEIAVDEEPEGVRVSPDDQWVVITCEENGTLVRLDRSTNKKEKTLKVGGRPRELVFTKNSDIAYVSNEYSKAVDVIDIVNFKVIKNIKVGALLPVGIVLSKDEKFLYVAGGRGKSVAEIDIEKGTVSHSAEVQKRPWGLDINNDKTLLVSANGSSNNISIITTTPFEVKRNINVGKGAWGVVIVPLYK